MRPSRILELLEREFLASGEGAHTPVPLRERVQFS